MPQIGDTSVSTGRAAKPLFLLAQGEAGGHGTSTDSPAGETHTGTHEEHEPKVGDLPDPMLLFYNAILVAGLLIAFALVARKRMEAVPKGIQNVAEMFVEYLRDFTLGIIGPHGEKYVPLIGTLFLFIISMNYIGLIPGLHSPTANISITLALGMIVFFYVQIQGIKANGLGGHLKHFMGPMPAMAPLMLPVELISELVKPFTLAIRLFGNIFGEDVILLVLAGLGASMFLPFQFPVMLLALLTGTVQALVFCMLTCIYISLVTHHEHEGEHDDDAHGIEHSHAAGH